MKKTLNYIEDKDILINEDWFYHAMPFSRNNYINVFNNGILAPYLLPNHHSSYKYVFINRKNKNSTNSSFDNYSIYPNFIINNNINAIKVDDSFIKKFIYCNFHRPKFTSLYDDEYQVYKKIKPENIIGILFNLEKLINTYDNKNNTYFNLLCDLVRILNELNITIPIIDYYTSKEINKQKVLSLLK